MKKKMGFTLVELLAVIVILSAILLIISPAVFSNLKKGKEKAYIEQTKILEESAERWSVKNAAEIDELTAYYLKIDTLIKEKYLSKNEILDPRDKKPMQGCIVITFNSENNQYNFKYNENACEVLQQH